MSKPKYYLDGSTVHFGAPSGRPVTDIPVGNWEVKYDLDRGVFYLAALDDFVLPEKVYGDVGTVAERYLTTFSKIDHSVGVLLTGLKGTGKSLLAKTLCVQAKVPVLIISEAFQGASFNAMIASIEQPCIVLFDEFEKVYRGEEMHARVGEKLLSLFDGVYTTKKMFILTCNEKKMISQAFFNRPTRIRYIKEYNGLDFPTMTEIVKDKLIHTEYAEELLVMLRGMGNMNIDLLLSMIEEMNMYKESVVESLKYLNLVPEAKAFTVTLTGGGYSTGSFGSDTKLLNPRDYIMHEEPEDPTTEYRFSLWCSHTKENGAKDYEHFMFEGKIADVKITEDATTGELTVVHPKDGWTLEIREKKESKNTGSHYTAAAYAL